MKKLFLFAGIALAALTSCNNDDIAGGGNGEGNGEGKTNYLTVNIVNTPDSRAAGDTSTGNPNGDATYEEGYSNENNVTAVRFYFFDADGNAAPVKFDSEKNYYDWTQGITPEGQEMPNVEKQLKATLLISTKAGDELPAQLVAVINPAAEGFTVGANTDPSLSLSQLRERTKNYANQVNGTTTTDFVMTNAVYSSDGTTAVAATKVTAANYAATADAALANPVNIYVERSVAKVRVTITAPEYDEETGLLELKDKEGSPIKVGDKQVYLKVGKWNLTADLNTGNFSKQILTAGTWPNTNLFTNWNYAPYFRSYWAENATTTDQEGGVKQNWYSYKDIATANGGGKGYDGELENSIYTNENAPQQAATTTDLQGAVVEPFTKVILAGELVTLNDDGSTTTNLELCKYITNDYVDRSNLITAMLGVLKAGGNLIYAATVGTAGDDGTQNMVFDDITAADVELKTALEAGVQGPTESEKTNGRYYVYLQLSAVGKGKVWSNSNTTMTVSQWNGGDNDRVMSETEVNTYLAKTLGHAQVYAEGKTYYYFPIQHLGAPGEIGFYGVVRNHIYDCKIEKLTGLGTPVYNPDQVIYPEKPQAEDTFIAAKINILSWRVVSNDYTLEW